MKTIALLMLLTSFNTASALSHLDGTYECKISYEERVDISINEGDAFPTILGKIEPARKRSEKLVLQFGKTGSEITVKALNAASSLPNWLLIMEHNQNRQDSWGLLDRHGLTYQVEWPTTWYFGSRIYIEVASISATSSIMHITLDDNDGWRLNLRNVGCSKK